MLDPAILRDRESASKMIQVSTQLVSEVTSGNVAILLTSQTPIDSRLLEELGTNSPFTPLLKKGADLNVYRGDEQLARVIHTTIKNYEKAEVLRIRQELDSKKSAGTTVSPMPPVKLEFIL